MIRERKAETGPGFRNVWIKTEEIVEVCSALITADNVLLVVYVFFLSAYFRNPLTSFTVSRFALLDLLAFAQGLDRNTSNRASGLIKIYSRKEY